MFIVNDVINEIDQLSLDDQEFIEDILHKKIIEKRRIEIAAAAKEAFDDYQNGKSQKGNFEEFWKEIND